MKKIIVIVAVLITLLSINKEYQEKEIIRFRIIANSNEEIDQQTKKELLKTISSELLESKKTYQEEKQYLISSIPTLTKKIQNKINTPFTIQYGDNYFPEKEYRGKTFKEGLYESLVITLGEGKGDNFWCILFPPLCMIDDEEDIEYKSFIKEVMKHIF